ncbi:MAG: hypothetical protein ACKVSF_03285 [Alphaproteobacteria bacterium]
MARTHGGRRRGFSDFVPAAGTLAVLAAASACGVAALLSDIAEAIHALWFAAALAHDIPRSDTVTAVVQQALLVLNIGGFRRPMAETRISRCD